MDKIQEMKNKLAELRELVKSMDIPDLRKKMESIHDVLWFIRNAPIRNSEHQNIKQSMALAKDISSVVK